jgi:hypothetical protein
MRELWPLCAAKSEGRQEARARPRRRCRLRPPCCPGQHQASRFPPPRNIHSTTTDTPTPHSPRRFACYINHPHHFCSCYLREAPTASKHSAVACLHTLTTLTEERASIATEASRAGLEGFALRSHEPASLRAYPPQRDTLARIGTAIRRRKPS